MSWTVERRKNPKKQGRAIIAEMTPLPREFADALRRFARCIHLALAAPRLLHLALFAVLSTSALPAGAKDLSEFERTLPKSAGGMSQVKIHKTAAEGQIIAFYGGKAGRATAFVIPITGEDGEGVTRASQAVLLDATAIGLKEGTRALGNTYWTGAVQTHAFKVDNLAMTCTKVEMRQGSETGAPDQMRLLDRRCFTQAGGVVIGAYVTTPFRGSLRSETEKDQLIFIGAFAAAMTHGKLNPPSKN